MINNIDKKDVIAIIIIIIIDIIVNIIVNNNINNDYDNYDDYDDKGEIMKKKMIMMMNKKR